MAMAAMLTAVAQGQDSTTAESTTADESSVLRIGWAQDPQTLNPFVALDEENYNVWSLNWDLLVNFSPEDLSPAPGIAESWEVSDDRKTVTFKLDPDRKWSDGEPFTADDILFWYEDILGNEELMPGGVVWMKNADGSTDVYFGPSVPEGKQSNWIQTIPGKGWNTIFRLYGPLEPWFDQTWRPGEIELVK